MIRRPPRSTLFPTRRSSDLVQRVRVRGAVVTRGGIGDACRSGYRRRVGQAAGGRDRDRKSTRLNSSHMSISYAVFCLKKKKKKKLKSNTPTDKTRQTTKIVV